ncbi:MAG: methyltransferase domain-containing protein [Acidobacteriota bacterium]
MSPEIDTLNPPEPIRFDGYMPQSEEIGELYDHLGPFYATIWDGDIHVGIWYGEEDDASMTEAQERLTRLLIERTEIGPGERLLDVGCGTGKPALQLAEETGCDVLGVTISPWQVDAANQAARDAGLADRVRFELADAMSLPYDEASFDAAWAFECLQHMPDFRHVLGQIGRVVRPGGSFILTDCVNEKPLTEEEKAIFFPALGVSSLTGKAHYPTWLRRAGFETLDMLELGDEIERTILMIQQGIEAKAEALREHYDDEFFAQMGGAWGRLSEIHRAKMSYLLISARRLDG